MSTVLMVWELGEGLGHVTGMRPVALRLREMGHTVVTAVRNVRSASVAFGDSGLTVLPCPYQTWHPQNRFTPLVSYAHLLHSAGFGDPVGFPALLAAWRSLFDLVRPDVIVFDHSPTALLAARNRDVRRVLLGHAFFSPPRTIPLPALRFDVPVGPTQIRDDERAVLDRTNEGLTTAGMPQLHALSDVFAAVDADIVTTFPELDVFPERKASSHVGVIATCPGAPPVWPAGTGPKVFAYLKQAPGLQELLGELVRTGFPALVYGPWVNRAAAARFPAPSLRLVARPVDIAAAAQECDLALLNGTATTTAQMLLHGVPVLQAPIFVEQALTSAKVVEMGAGLTVKATDSGAVAAALRTMTGSDQFLRAAKAFSAAHENFNSGLLLDDVTAAIVPSTD